MQEFVKLGLNLNITIWHWYQYMPPTEKTNEVAEEEFYSSLEKVCDVFTYSSMKRVLWDFNAEIKKSPIYIQHVDGTAFTMKQIIMENEWLILHWEET